MITFRTVTSCWSIDVAPAKSSLNLLKSKSTTSQLNSFKERINILGITICATWQGLKFNKLPFDIFSAYFGGKTNSATRISEFFFKLSLFFIDDTRRDKEFMMHLLLIAIPIILKDPWEADEIFLKFYDGKQSTKQQNQIFDSCLILINHSSVNYKSAVVNVWNIKYSWGRIFESFTI